MTAKRFTIQGQSIKHNDELLTLDMVCEMLNDYAEENEQLKKQLNAFKPIIFEDVNNGSSILYEKELEE